MKGEQCHICGKPAYNEAIVEGADVFLCDNCMHYGKRVKRAAVPKSPNFGFGGQHAATHPTTPLLPKTTPYHHEYYAVEGYGMIIKGAREALHLTRQELGNKLFISENVIERLEDELLKPELKIARKLQDYLKIKIIEEEKPPTADETKDFQGSRNKPSATGTTFADVVDIKTKQKK
ncbi:MAG: multiprotein-bridging factor 1 family protein [Candidatus Micrarchaeota archaeon]